MKHRRIESDNTATDNAFIANNGDARVASKVTDDDTVVDDAPFVKISNDGTVTDKV